MLNSASPTKMSVAAAAAVIRRLGFSSLSWRSDRRMKSISIAPSRNRSGLESTGRWILSRIPSIGTRNTIPTNTAISHGISRLVCGQSSVAAVRWRSADGSPSGLIARRRRLGQRRHVAWVRVAVGERRIRVGPDRLEVRVGGVRVPPRFGEVALRGRSAGLWPRGLAAAPGPCGPQFGGEEDAAAPKQQDYEADDAGHLGAGAGV